MLEVIPFLLQYIFGTQFKAAPYVSFTKKEIPECSASSVKINPRWWKTQEIMILYTYNLINTQKVAIKK